MRLMLVEDNSIILSALLLDVTFWLLITEIDKPTEYTTVRLYFSTLHTFCLRAENIYYIHHGVIDITLMLTKNVPIVLMALGLDVMFS